MQGEGEISHTLTQLRSTDVVPFLVTFVAHHDLLGALARRLVEQVIECPRSASTHHLFHLIYGWLLNCKILTGIVKTRIETPLSRA
jgi:hypothetical protein